MSKLADKVSLVIVTYYTGSAWWKCLETAVEQVAEVIIVNNGNGEKTLSRLNDFCDGHSMVSLITGHGNIGFSAACNLGASKSCHNLLMFLNPDAILHRDTVDQLSACLATLPAMSVVGARLLNESGTEQRGGRRGKLTLWSALVALSGLYKLERFSSLFADMHWEKQALPEQPIEVPSISGACMMFRKKDFESLEGFDEKYFLHVEDLDICRVVRNSNGKVVFVPTAEVTHIGSTSRVSMLAVNWHKAKGLIRYFVKFSNSTPELTTIYLVSPLIAGAIMFRALLLSLRILKTLN
ncbi:MAG: glycosyltransferase family 2 protein [Robiginitomaculum sp.]|nr:glycosyltransferase family 2 protein [Robiginitomaculum sp.]